MGGLFVFLVLFLSSCSAAEVESSEVVSTAQVQTAATTSLAIPSPEHTGTPENSPGTPPFIPLDPTGIPQTSTATRTPVPSRTPIPTPTLPPEIVAATATQQALEAHFPCKWTFGKITQSPDGRWFALGCTNDVTAFVRLDDGTVWYLKVEDLISSLDPDFYSAYVFHWSNDSEYAYWGADPHTDGFWEPFHQATSLFRFHLESGQITKVLPIGTNPSEYFAFEFSPVDETLVYIETDKSPVVLRLLDLETGNVQEEIAFHPKYNTGGGFVWSPDGTRFVFSVVQFQQEGYDYPAASIFMWDEVDLTLTVLVEDYGDFLAPVEWVDETTILLEAWIGEKGIFETQIFELDLTGSPDLTPIDP